MRKEKLMDLKRDKARSMLSYSEARMLDIENNPDLLSKFSINQIEIICKLLLNLDKIIKDNSPFVELSATEVFEKSTGKIAEITEDGVREESEDDVLLGASALIYKKAKKALATADVVRTKGKTNGFKWEVKHHKESSKYGINGGKISKLYIQRESNGEIIALYDRGWDILPDIRLDCGWDIQSTEAVNGMEVYKMLLEKFN